MTYTCVKCGCDISVEAEKAKNEAPITVAHIITRDANTQRNSDYAASVFAVICTHCGQINMFPLKTQTLRLN